MNKRIRSYFVLVLLALLFIAPGVGAYFFYRHPSYLGESKVNRGVLLKHPLLLKTLDKDNKWKLVFLSPQNCDTNCLQQLDSLSRIRVALGRKYYEVSQSLLVDEKKTLIMDNLSYLLKQQKINVTVLSSPEVKKLTALSSNVRVFIANPDNYLILGYKQGVQPDDVYTDLKLLLNTVKNKAD
ncbi:MAG: hypothetical protein H0U75_01460 [Legionella sp.]|nr:hypothetical protein [Legionella sp.]